MGAALTSFTVTVKDFESLRFGEPLSVTTTVMLFVLGPCASLGVHEIAPVLGLIVIPAGGERRLKVNVLVGTSESVAEAETFNVVSSLITRFVGTVRTGAVLTSFTVMVKDFVSLRL